MLFAHVGKSSSETLRSSRSQMFLKIGVLKNFLIFEKKQLCLSLLIKLHALRPAFLLKQRFRHMRFPVNIAKFLKTAFLWNSVCSLYFSEILYDDRIPWTSLGRYKIDVLHISCTIALFSFITLVLESGVRSYFVLNFIPKFLVSVTFARITTSVPALMLQH